MSTKYYYDYLIFLKTNKHNDGHKENEIKILYTTFFVHFDTWNLKINSQVNFFAKF